MADTITLKIDGTVIRVPPGTTVAAAFLLSGRTFTRRSASGEPRGPMCGMGICFECRVTIDGQPHQRSCLVLCSEGMEVQHDE